MFRIFVSGFQATVSTTKTRAVTNADASLARIRSLPDILPTRVHWPRRRRPTPWQRQPTGPNISSSQHLPSTLCPLPTSLGRASCLHRPRLLQTSRKSEQSTYLCLLSNLDAVFPPIHPRTMRRLSTLLRRLSIPYDSYLYLVRFGSCMHTISSSPT